MKNLEKVKTKIKKQIRPVIKRELRHLLHPFWQPFYSQAGEDKLIYKVIGRKPNGFYIDVGAWCPDRLSNTYFFYQLGWAGLCIEPNPDLIDQFQIVRPRDKVLNIAVSNFEGEANFFTSQSTVFNSLSPRANIHESKLVVKVRRLESILDEIQAPKTIDFISIDTEGTEIDVLEGLNLEKYRPRLILVEYNTDKVINTKLQPYLISQGYSIIYISHCNIIASSDFERDALLLG
ncbi:MAG: FkbM family methyltransferase [Coleofasciculus sp. A1-SPW-01]|uniref:FkbM family methyltransferase n=1 Tax=Coleofasciculus sp. A1-SPW-01 TaxID=3070819 RepID=UPI0032F964EE